MFPSFVVPVIAPGDHAFLQLMEFYINAFFTSY